jgi:hypothetical protein
MARFRAISSGDISQIPGVMKGKREWARVGGVTISSQGELGSSGVVWGVDRVEDIVRFGVGRDEVKGDSGDLSDEDGF